VTETDLPTRFRCSGCGTTIDDPSLLPFRCPIARDGDDIDHVLGREIDLGRGAPPSGRPPASNPFLRFRDLFHARHLGRARGLTDGELDDRILRLDEAVAVIEGRGFRQTPFTRSKTLSDALGFTAEGGLWIKDETGNVAGSHKARHLFGIALYLDLRRRLGLSPAHPSPRLAIASCGNAALAAAVVASAARLPLDVYVPTDADDALISRLRDLDAHILSCRRDSGTPGDPCVHRFREAIAAGAIPFTCQGSENGLAIEGGHTLGWEIATALAESSRPLDRLVVQVGGGALASALIASLREARDLGLLPALPRIHAVQTAGSHPLERAHRRVAERMRARGEAIDDALGYAAGHRSEFMWPWETPPRSIAEGILDDETYDWLAVVRGMLETGGGPVVVDEPGLRRANELAEGTTPSAPSITGTAGLAGLLTLRETGEMDPGETVAVLYTGARRGRGG
jgi:threonine synthase